VALLIVWAAYRFHTGTLDDARLEALAPEALPHLAAVYARVPGYEWVRADLIQRCRDYCGDAAKHGVTGIDFVDWAKAAGYPSPLAGRTGRDTMAGAPPFHRRAIDAVLDPFRAAAHRIEQRVDIPAPLFFAGIERVEYHATLGHPAFLLGRTADHGWWYYFPVIFFFKTPLPFFILALAGIIALLSGTREARAVALAPILMFIPPMTTSINIGVRHILPIYPFLAICAAYASMKMWQHSHVNVSSRAGEARRGIPFACAKAHRSCEGDSIWQRRYSSSSSSSAPAFLYFFVLL